MVQFFRQQWLRPPVRLQFACQPKQCLDCLFFAQVQSLSDIAGTLKQMQPSPI